MEYVGIVEYAPFQRIPKKKKKKDPKCGTIESDPIYQDFVEGLKKDPETENQPKLEYSYPVNDGKYIFKQRFMLIKAYILVKKKWKDDESQKEMQVSCQFFSIRMIFWNSALRVIIVTF